ncbi:MAG: hypothetical protein ACLTML_13150 [Blautia faecis]
MKRGCLNLVLKLVLIKDIIYNVQMEHLQSLPGDSLPNKLEEGLIVTPLKTDKVWKWIYPRYKKSLKLEILFLKRLQLLD